MAQPSTKPEPVKPVVSVPFRIEPVTQRQRYLKALIYGKHGVGKTYLAATAVQVEDMKDVLLISAEAGDLTLVTDDGRFDDLDMILVKDFKTFSDVYNYLRVHCKARDEGNTDKLRDLEAKLKGVDPKDIKEPRQYHTVIIDSLSEVEQYCMNQLLGVGDNTALNEDPTPAEFKEYKQNHTMIQRLVRYFRDLPMHVIFTCADQYDQDENKRYKYTLRLTGKLSSQIQGFMDVVGFLVTGQDDSGKTIRRLNVQPNARYDAKCRFSKFTHPHFDNPDIEEITKAIGLI